MNTDESKKDQTTETGKKKFSLINFLFGWIKSSPKEEPIKTKNEDGTPRDPAEIEAEEKAREESKKNTPKKGNAWPLIIILIIIIACIAIWQFTENDKKKEPVKKEQPGGGNTQPGGSNTQPGGGNTQPGGGNTQPVVQIELPTANGEHNWSTCNQIMLTKAMTTTPDLKGEKVLLVYIIKGHPMGEMVWIQTDQGSGPVRNILCEKKYTKF